MTKEAELKELERRLMEATGPMRELDAAIVVAIGGEIMRSPAGGWVYRNPPTSGDHGWKRIPEYTTSVDAALSLVPEGHSVWMKRSHRQHLMAASNMDEACVAPKGLGGSRNTKKTRHLHAYAKTLPVALCLACIRALLSQEPTP